MRDSGVDECFELAPIGGLDLSATFAEDVTFSAQVDTACDAVTERCRLPPEQEAEPRAPAERLDPESVYVRRVIPELGTPDYPSPMVMAV
jgi:hypothetical protein